MVLKWKLYNVVLKTITVANIIIWPVAIPMNGKDALVSKLVLRHPGFQESG